MHIVILAGGGGTRLWPLSRQNFPKQFLQFGDHRSLLQKTVARFAGSFLAKSISVITNAQYEPLVRKQLEKIDTKVQIFIEPCKKNTAPAIAFAIKHLQEMGVSETDPVLVLPSDHFIDSEKTFLAYLEKIQPLVQKDHLVLFGVQPTKPETGYGYIQAGEKYDASTYKIAQFIEKPDLARAKTYVASGTYYWNMGMFAFSVHLFLKKLVIHSPEINRLMQGSLEEMVEQFDQMPNISFDYAVLEKVDNGLVCPLPIQWSDVGCWDSVYEMLGKDINQNVTFGNVFPIETKNSLILGGKKLISTIGLEDIVVVETDDVIFITKKEHSQKVKDLVQELVKMGKISS